jgi:hypothetical protein
MKDTELIPATLGAIFGAQWPLIKGHPQIRKMLEGIEMATRAETDGLELMRQRLLKVVSEELDG